MQSFFFSWRFLLLASTFAFPQLLGILLYFRLSRAPRWLAAITGTLAPAVLFVLLAPILLFADYVKPPLRLRRCGMPAFGAILFLYAGATIQLVLGVFTQLVLFARRRQASKP